MRLTWNKQKNTEVILYNFHLIKKQLSLPESLDCCLLNCPSRSDELGLHGKHLQGSVLFLLLDVENLSEEVRQVAFEDDLPDSVVLDNVDSDSCDVSHLFLERIFVHL
jgi:hypothetical protein